MAAGIKDIITQLEQQRVAIERALSALREVDENPTVSAPAASSASPSGKAAAKKKRKGGMTPEGKQRLIAALKARWAARKAAEGESKPAAVKKVPGKRGRPRKTN